MVSFGNPLAPVATLGINPSSGEFTDGSGQLLDGDRRRLATLESLGASAGAALSREEAGRVVDQCAAYFSRNPYHWFKKLDPILITGLGRSYWSGGACHLDLVQWATDPLWSGLTDMQRNELLRQDRPFLLEQLGQERLQLVLVNGRTALNGVADAGVVAWEQICRIAGDPDTGQPAFDVYRGERAGRVFLGWSVDVPNQHGGLAARSTLAELMAEHGRPVLAAADGGVGPQADPVASQGLHCTDRPALIDLLRRWLVSTDRPILQLQAVRPVSRASDRHAGPETRLRHPVRFEAARPNGVRPGHGLRCRELAAICPL